MNPRRTATVLDGLTDDERELVLWAIDRAVNYGPAQEAGEENIPILRSAWDKIANPLRTLSHHDRRLQERLKDPEFRAEFERVRNEEL